jgi:hypothetical protein
MVRAAKLNQVRREGKLDDAFGPAFAPGFINTRHEIAEGHGPSVGMGFCLRDLIRFHFMMVALFVFIRF